MSSSSSSSSSSSAAVANAAKRPRLAFLHAPQGAHRPETAYDKLAGNEDRKEEEEGEGAGGAGGGGASSAAAAAPGSAAATLAVEKKTKKRRAKPLAATAPKSFIEIGNDMWFTILEMTPARHLGRWILNKYLQSLVQRHHAQCRWRAADMNKLAQRWVEIREHSRRSAELREWCPGVKHWLRTLTFTKVPPQDEYERIDEVRELRVAGEFESQLAYRVPNLEVLKFGDKPGRLSTSLYALKRVPLLRRIEGGAGDLSSEMFSPELKSMREICGRIDVYDVSPMRDFYSIDINPRLRVVHLNDVDLDYMSFLADMEYDRLLLNILKSCPQLEELYGVPIQHTGCNVRFVRNRCPSLRRIAVHFGARWLEGYRGTKDTRYTYDGRPIKHTLGPWPFRFGEPDDVHCAGGVPSIPEPRLRKRILITFPPPPPPPASSSSSSSSSSAAAPQRVHADESESDSDAE